MQTSYRNGLHVVEDAVDFNAVDAALYDVDAHLFLSYEISRGQKVYRVLYDRGDDEPAEISRWPHPLSHALVDQVKALRPRDGQVDFDAPRKANEELEARQLADFDEALEGIVKDMGPRMEGRKRTTIPRSASLARARSRTGYHRRQDLR